ncbi:MAG: hypothetical protein WCP16_16285 [Pseudanabaena sp. ELA645]|jgi:hypothetical protein
MEIAIALLQHYSFDLGGYTISDLTLTWGGFKPEWVRQAVIESLFQGRYKAVSVNQILQQWDRKGEANYRYNHEFERLICGDVAVIYEDRIFYTPPRTSNREVAIAEISPLNITESQASASPFPHRGMLGGLKISQDSPKAQKYSEKHLDQLVKTSGTTKPSMAYHTPSKTAYSEAYLSAYENMALLAESSMFVDKLRSMCGDRLVLPVPEINSEIDKAIV